MPNYGDDMIRKALDDVIKKNSRKDSLQSAFNALYETYEGLIKSGFNEQQATYFVGELINGLGKGLTGRK